MADDGVQVLLDALRADGSVDSQGAFTLDGEAAREKLARFRLLRPELWIVQMVACAVAGRASTCHITRGLHGWRIEFDCVPAPLDDGGVVVGNDGASVALAAGLDAALALRPRQVELVTDTGAATTTLIVEGTERRLERGPGGKGPSTTIEVHEGNVWRAISTLGAADLPEEQALQALCAWAPLELTVNGRPIRGSLPEEKIASRHLRDETGAARLPFEPDASAVPIPGLSAALWIGEGGARWTIGVNGVSQRLDAPFRNLWCIAASAEARLDLSGLRAVENERWKALVERLREEAVALVFKACDDLDLLMRLETAPLLRLIEAVLDVEDLFNHDRADPRLKTLVRARALICARHGPPLVRGGIDTIRILSTLPSYDPGTDRGHVELACEALADLFSRGQYCNGNRFPIPVGTDDGRRLDPFLAQWLRLAPSVPCAHAHLAAALDAALRTDPEDALARLRPALAIGDDLTLQVEALLERAAGRPEEGFRLHERRGTRASKQAADSKIFHDPPDDDKRAAAAPFLDALAHLAKCDAAFLRGDLGAALTEARSARIGFDKVYGWAGRMWRIAAQEAVSQALELQDRGAEALEAWDESLSLHFGQRIPATPDSVGVEAATALNVRRRLRRLAGRVESEGGGWRELVSFLRGAIRGGMLRDGMREAQRLDVRGSAEGALAAYRAVACQGPGDSRHDAVLSRVAFLHRRLGQWREADACAAILHLRRLALEGPRP